MVMILQNEQTIKEDALKEHNLYCSCQKQFSSILPPFYHVSLVSLFLFSYQHHFPGDTGNSLSQHI